MIKFGSELVDRFLQFDGVSIVEPDIVADLLMRGCSTKMIRLTHQNEETEKFNSLVDSDDRLVEQQVVPVRISMEWQIPTEFATLDLNDFVITAYVNQIQSLGKEYTEDQLRESELRIAKELEEISRRGMVEFTKTIIYILHILREKNIVWGVGRGSSCASYVLFILGLHVVDCIKYNVPMEEFFHD